MVSFATPPMPKRSCPQCQKTGRFLADSSAKSTVDYYRCDYCGEVWCLDRDDPTKPLKIVTLPKTDPDRS
jgi:hypothetical protein